MTWNPQSERLWKQLQQQPQQIGTYWAMEAVPGPKGALLAQDSKRGDRHLLLRCDVNLRFTPDVKSRGVKIEKRVLVGSSEEHFIDFWCTDPGKQKLFGLMADEVISRMLAGEGEGPSLAVSVLNAWRGLLGAESGLLLSFEKQVGLYAELLVLERLIAKHGPSAVDAWVGPTGQPHDFMGVSGDIEVKGTVGGGAVRIHGIRQLAKANGQPLHIWGIHLAPTPGGLSLPALVQRIRATVPGDDKLLTRLGEVGYRTADESHYVETVFNVAGEIVCEVSGDFPRITPDLWPSGAEPGAIKSVEYGISLNDGGLSPLSANEIEELLNSLLVAS